MFEVIVNGHFDAAHYLKGYQGKCESIHGHRFYVAVGLRGKRLNKIGILYDFVQLRGQIKEVLDKLDHTCLNDLPPFREANPSAENLAYFIYQELSSKLPRDLIYFIEVAESPESRARYYPD